MEAFQPLAKILRLETKPTREESFSMIEQDVLEELWFRQRDRSESQLPLDWNVMMNMVRRGTLYDTDLARDDVHQAVCSLLDRGFAELNTEETEQLTELGNTAWEKIRSVSPRIRFFGVKVKIPVKN